jgi:hypothetical protein
MMKKVKIKGWKNLVNEFGKTHDGGVACKNVYTKDMEKNMPSNRIIEVNSGRAGSFTWHIGERYWAISKDMVEEYIKDAGTVKVKSWTTLEEEFGLDGTDSINCKFGFTKEMEKQLPEDRIIEVDYYSEDNSYKWLVGDGEYWLTDEMLE